MDCNKIDQATKPQKNSPKKRGPKLQKGKITPTKISVWQLRALGYTVSTVAQNLGLSEASVIRYSREVRDTYGELPSVRAAIDTLATKIPKAIRILDICMDRALEKGASPKFLKIGCDVSIGVLNNFKVLTEKTEQNLADQRDQDLIKEAERIIARRQGAAVRYNK